MINWQKSKTLQVANYFIYKNKIDPKQLTNKKLQKLLYYSQAWNLVINNEKLFDDKIEAWIHGPSIPSIYLEFKKFGYNEIKLDIEKSDFSDITEQEKNVLDSVWNVYGKYDANYLEFLTHNEAPWQKARSGLMPYESSSAEISVDEMKSYYGQRSK